MDLNTKNRFNQLSPDITALYGTLRKKIPSAEGKIKSAAKSITKEGMVLRK